MFITTISSNILYAAEIKKAYVEKIVKSPDTAAKTMEGVDYYIVPLFIETYRYGLVIMYTNFLSIIKNK